MTTDILEKKIKTLEARISLLESSLPHTAPRKQVAFRDAVKGVKGIWKSKPRTAKDLVRVRRRIWG